MPRLLTHAIINVITAAVALVVTSQLVDGVQISVSGFIVAVLVFVAANAILGPFVFNMARKYAPAALGGIGLLSTLSALFVATLFDGGLTISGMTAWIAAPLVVWIITALGGWAALAYWTKSRAAARRKRADLDGPEGN